MEELAIASSPALENLSILPLATNQTHKFCMGIVNCCSVCKERPGLEAVIDFHKFNFLIGTESHLDDFVLNDEIFTSHYNVYGRGKTDMEVAFLF